MNGVLTIGKWDKEDPGVVNVNPLKYSCLENSMNREPSGLQSMGSQSSTWLRNSAHTHFIQNKATKVRKNPVTLGSNANSGSTQPRGVCTLTQLFISHSSWHVLYQEKGFPPSPTIFNYSQSLFTIILLWKNFCAFLAYHLLWKKFCAFLAFARICVIEITFVSITGNLEYSFQFCC